MTLRMENALNHIKTSVDVNPWAVEEIERVFKAIDDIKAEIRKLEWYGDDAFWDGVNAVSDIIDNHIGERNEDEVNN